MKKGQLLAILAAISLASLSFMPLSVYADGELSNDETNQPSDDQGETNQDNWHQIGGGSNGSEDGPGELNELETEPAQPQNPNANTDQTPSTPSSSTSNNSTSTSTTSKPTSNVNTTSNKTQATTSASKPSQVTSSTQNSESGNTVLENTTSSDSDNKVESSISNPTSSAQDDYVAVPETGSKSDQKPFALDLDLRLAGIIAAIAIVVCGLGSVIFINLRRNRKAVRSSSEDPEEFWTTNDSEAIEDDFEFPAIDLDAEEKKIKTTKAAKAETKAAKAEKKATSKSEKK